MNLNNLTKEEREDFFANIEFEKSKEIFLKGLLPSKIMEIKEEAKMEKWQENYYKELNDRHNKRLRKLDNGFF